MAATTSTIEHAREFLERENYNSAIELLSKVDDPSPEEIYTLADAYFLKFSLAREKDEAKSACRTAMKLYPLCYADCTNPRMACIHWVQCARMLEDEKELIRAKEAGLEHKGGVIFVLYHYVLKRELIARNLGQLAMKGELDAAEEECEELLEQAYQLDPKDPNVLFQKAHILMRKEEWKRALELQSLAANETSDNFRAHSRFPEMLVRAALLSLIVGEDESAYLIWARSRDPEHEWVKLAESITSAGTKKEAVEKAKQALSGEIGPGVSPMTWLAEQEPEEEENAQASKGKEVQKKKEYTPNIIEQMTPEMREELLIELLAKGMRSSG
jgi:tetratricopeptide (TPR) repeat protein